MGDTIDWYIYILVIIIIIEWPWLQYITMSHSMLPKELLKWVGWDRGVGQIMVGITANGADRIIQHIVLVEED